MHAQRTGDKMWEIGASEKSDELLHQGHVTSTELKARTD